MSKFALFSVLLLCSSLTGCLGSDDSFEWPSPSEQDCAIVVEFNLECEIYIPGQETPHYSLSNSENGDLWIIYLSGFIKSWDGTSLSEVVDLSSLVSRCHMEQGLLGFAFDDDFIDSNLIIISYIENGPCEGDNESDLILASLQVGDNDLIDKSTITTLRIIDQPYRNHNGGHLLSIGNNQYLLGLGDGGSGSDPHGHGQNKNNSLGSINLFSFENNEIKPVLEDSYKDPYVLHYGLRNPWRFSLGVDNMLWISDVGQNCWEEVNLVPMNETKNLGWSSKEAYQDFEKNANCELSENNQDEDLTYPVTYYVHQDGNCSITGGYWMDWGPSSLSDGYLYADFCTGIMWLLKEENGNWESEFIGYAGGMIVGFGKGLGEELLIFLWTGNIIAIK
tara:strand:+ start:1144 stop:2319 length:1176 start_codon:yes stop_codon:yes gene_type:complete